MDAEIAKLWTDALESGKYKQGRLFLSKDDAYCCLGVLCEVAIKNGIALEICEDRGVKVYDGACAAVPDSILKWSGMRRSDGFIFNDGCCLANLNDIDRLSFEEIAVVIKKVYEQL